MELTALLGYAAVTALIIGVIWRRRAAESWAFASNSGFVLLSGLPTLAWPALYTRHYWLVTETLQCAFQFAIALELAWRVFGAFPGAHATARRLMLMVAVVGVVATGAAVRLDSDYFWVGGALLARVTAVNLWFFMTLAALVLWYRIPVTPFQKAIMMGFVPYLLSFLAGLAAWGATEGSVPLVMLGNQITFGLTFAYWAHAAWRRDSPSPAAKPTGL